MEHLAIIDLGTNTFHLLIIALQDNGAFEVVQRLKEPVKLGEGGIEDGVITPEAFERGLKALERLRTLIDAKDATRILAFATSAVRSARNGSDFVRAAAERTGIPIEIIYGNEEAALIYEGVRYGVSLPADEDVLLVDIGGGSVEFIVGNRFHAKLLRSVDVGAARMLALLNPSDPLSPTDIARAEALFDERLGPLLSELRTFKLETLVGSSGTFETLGALAAHDAGEKVYADQLLNGYRFDLRRYRKIHKRLLSSTTAERHGMSGVEPMRVNMIMMGTLLTQYLTQKLPIRDIVVSTYALKEGILVNYLRTSRDAATRHTPSADAREEEILKLAERFGYMPDKSEHIAMLALRLFEQTQNLHGLGPDARELLRYAIYLIDIGSCINRSGRHKHAQYIIQNSAMPGFSGKELILLGNLVRYHRKSLPSPEHLHYNVLYKEDKDLVNALAGILRLAIALNRSQRSVVRNPVLVVLPDRMTLSVEADAAIDLELEAANEDKTLFELAFQRPLTIVQNAHTPAHG